MLVGDAHGGGDRAELHAQEFGVRTADVGGLGELHVLAGLQNLQRARLQPGERAPLASGSAFAHQVVLGVLARDETREHRGGFLRTSSASSYWSSSLSLTSARASHGFAPDLARAQRAEQMDDFAGGIDAHRVHPAPVPTSAPADRPRMRAVQVVGDAPSELVELDAGARITFPDGRSRVQVAGRCSGSSNCSLQATGQAILRAAGAADQAFAAFEHGAAGQRLQAVEIGLSGAHRLPPSSRATVPPRPVDRFVA